MSTAAEAPSAVATVMTPPQAADGRRREAAIRLGGENATGPQVADDRRAVDTRPHAQLRAVRAFVLWRGAGQAPPRRRERMSSALTSAGTHEEPARRRRGGPAACAASASARRLNAANSLAPAWIDW